MELISIAISASLINNIVLSQFLGICPFLGVSKDVKPAIGMGSAVTFVMLIASVSCFSIHKYVLKPFGIEFLYTITFILVIASLVQFAEMFMKRYVSALYSVLGVYLPLMVTNCAIFGIVVTNMQKSYTLIEAIVNALATGLGFTIAIVLFAGIREHIEDKDVPDSFKGMPITLMAAAILSMAFMGFAGILS